MTTFLSQAELEALQKFDTPTVCNALELLDSRFRTLGFTHQPLVCFDPSLPPVIGYARTATIRAHEQSLLNPEQLRQRRIEYYEYMAQGPRPAVVVIQDLDNEPGFGAFWGEVNTAVHQALGLQGVITNGSFRDLDACAAGFQILAGKIAPSHAHVHVIDTDIAVNIHGMPVRPGELIHADQHGAVVIPHELARQVSAAAQLLATREKVILDACKADDFSIDTLTSALTKSADIH